MNVKPLVTTVALALITASPTAAAPQTEIVYLGWREIHTVVSSTPIKVLEDRKDFVLLHCTAGSRQAAPEAFTHFTECEPNTYVRIERGSQVVGGNPSCEQKNGNIIVKKATRFQVTLKCGVTS